MVARERGIIRRQKRNCRTKIFENKDVNIQTYTYLNEYKDMREMQCYKNVPREGI